jgi:hypothetical protein
MKFLFFISNPINFGISYLKKTLAISVYLQTFLDTSALFRFAA